MRKLTNRTMKIPTECHTKRLPRRGVSIYMTGTERRELGWEAIRNGETLSDMVRLKMGLRRFRETSEEAFSG